MKRHEIKGHNLEDLNDKMTRGHVVNPGRG